MFNNIPDILLKAVTVASRKLGAQDVFLERFNKSCEFFSFVNTHTERERGGGSYDVWGRGKVPTPSLFAQGDARPDGAVMMGRGWLCLPDGAPGAGKRAERLNRSLFFRALTRRRGFLRLGVEGPVNVGGVLCISLKKAVISVPIFSGQTSR